MRWRARARSASCCTTTSRPTRSARRAAWARPAAARSATASWPGAPCVRCCRAPEEFPYTVRVVSEITEVNGSSSMATVCGASLALMDAGVPLKAPVAGIAMGLIKEGNDFAVLSDILGDEDHLGDMDFKVAGTENGVTSLQMDIKITGITEEIMRVALDQAHAGRMHILGEMSQGAHGRAHRARRACAAHRDHQDPGRQDPRGDRLGRLGDPRDRGRERRQDRHRGRRHHQDRRRQARGDRGGAEPHPGHHVGARGRHDLQGQGREDHGVRRLRELLRRQGRPRAHLAADAGPAARPWARSSRRARRSTSSCWASTIAARCACR